MHPTARPWAPSHARRLTPRLGLLVGLSWGLVGPAVASQPPPDPAEIRVEIASVTLGQECDPHAGAKAEAAIKADADVSAEAAADKSASKRKRACEQSTLQLSVWGAQVGKPVELRLGAVELLDEQGRTLGRLVAREPTRFDGGVYHAWDRQIAPRSTQTVSYKLGEAPVPIAHGTGYRVQVHVTVGGRDRKVTKAVRLESPAYLPPDVKT
jgi:hypothetical protein